MVLAVAAVSAYSSNECFWTGHGCSYGMEGLHNWDSGLWPGPEDIYNWQYQDSVYGGYWNANTNANYPVIVDNSGWGNELDYGRYYYNNYRTWTDSGSYYNYNSYNYNSHNYNPYNYNYQDNYYQANSSGSNYFYMIKNEQMDPLYKRGCWNGYCEWYDIHDPHDYIRWTDLQNAIKEDCNGNESLCS